ncbi:MAG: hypothetical protein NTY48_03240, partial [Candidatus Diapherotrites archaeon]|nr:hypothetical protein [Candidatus Diapherotrites archaeon]
FDLVESVSLKVIGKTESQLRSEKKQPQRVLLKNFFDWAAKIQKKDLLCYHPQFDFGFLRLRAQRYGLKVPFQHKCFDLHTIAAVKYFEINGKFLESDGISAMRSSTLFEYCGLKDHRVRMKNNEIEKAGNPHNGLDDAKMEAECFSRIVYKKGLLEEFKKFKIPDYLLKK